MKKKILILSANPRDTSQLRLEEEVRKIKLAKERSLLRDKFEIITWSAAHISDLDQNLLNYNPQIIHFSGHGTGDSGITLENELEQGQSISTEALTDLFESFKSTTECVVLNACDSEIQAKAISKHIDYVISMKSSITDDAAIIFSTGFYEAIFAGRNYQDAFDFGCKKIARNSIPQHLIPTINIREDIKPKTTTLSETDLEKSIWKCITQRRYRKLQKISEGIEASIYKARDNYLERDVAIKVFHSDDSSSKEDFKNSVMQAVAISLERNCITIYDASFQSKYYYYIMEFIQGSTISEYIDKKETFTYQDICSIILRIGNTLISSGNIKFNIKPSNILIVEDENDKACKFKPFISPLNLSDKQIYADLKTLENYLEKLKEQDENKYREELASLIPEVLKFNSDKVERPEFKQSAQYSLGLLAYELFTSEIPSIYQDHTNLTQTQEPKELPPFIKKSLDCPEIIEKIILKMASPKPENRYKDIREPLNLIYRHIKFIGFNLNIVKESYKRCAFQPNFDNGFFDIFYKNFIDKCPKAQEKFSQFKEKNEKEKEYWNRQHKLLKQAVLFLFTYFEEKDELDSSSYYEQAEPNILSRIAEIHDRHNKDIPPNMYPAFVDALINTVIDFDPNCKDSKKNSDIVKEAWKKVLEPGVEYMKRKYNHN
jgi:serine/threonine protein kinase